MQKQTTYHVAFFLDVCCSGMEPFFFVGGRHSFRKEVLCVRSEGDAYDITVELLLLESEIQ